MTSEIVAGGFNAIGKGGMVVLTGLNKLMEQNIELPGTILTLFRKSIKGSLFGDCNPTTDIPKILGLYQSGDIKLDEIITRTYTLDQVNEGYDDLLARQERPRRCRPLALSVAPVTSSPSTSVGQAFPVREPTEVVGRAAEAELLEAALLSGAHVLLEGPPGTGKSDPAAPGRQRTGRSRSSWSRATPS